MDGGNQAEAGGGTTMSSEATAIMGNRAGQQLSWRR